MPKTALMNNPKKQLLIHAILVWTVSDEPVIWLPAYDIKDVISGACKVFTMVKKQTRDGVFCIIFFSFIKRVSCFGVFGVYCLEMGGMSLWCSIFIE